mgnify:FL=1|tara:strand:+ start:2975 stop:3907 length:933 start_codon:yes stop_codon:yes gene_type:complete
MIAFFTEGGYTGKVPRNIPMRTDQAWVCALDAVHHCIFKLNEVNQKYDIGVVIIPKEKNREYLVKQQYPLIDNIRNYCDKVIIMQEGCHWDWMEDPVETMVWFYNQLLKADLLLCHNDADVKYYQGITNIKSLILPTLMIEDIIKTAPQEDRVFVAGNWHLTYRGFDAWVISNEFDMPKYGFKAGKYKEGEDINGINYLPWMQWDQFMLELSKCKYGIQTYQSSAGQFPLNCAYLGIPCIGYNDVNTQRDLFPNLSVDRGDIVAARKLANELQNNKDYYRECSKIAKFNYNQWYKEDKFLEQWKIIESHL